MFKDTQDALQKLEQQLLASEEEPTQALPPLKEETLRTDIESALSGEAPAEHPGRYQNFANNYGGALQNTPPVEEELTEEELTEEEPEELPSEEEPDYRDNCLGLWILLGSLMLATAMVIVYLVLRVKGSLG